MTKAGGLGGPELMSLLQGEGLFFAHVPLCVGLPQVKGGLGPSSSSSEILQQVVGSQPDVVTGSSAGSVQLIVSWVFHLWKSSMSSFSHGSGL